MKTVNATTPTTKYARRRPGLTLIELLVAMAIIAILLGVLVVSSRAVLNTQNRSNSKQQIMMIAAAIDKYATFWPTWETFDQNGRIVKVADRGWPDFLPARLFATGFPNSPYGADFNGRFNDIANGLTFAVDNHADFGFGFGGIIEASDNPTINNGAPDKVVEGDVLNANICLAYALTAKTGKGPYIEVDDDKALLQDVAGTVTTYTPDYPRPNTAATTNLHNVSIAGRKLMLVDPWGTPYRYFWVFRNDLSPSGYSPVPTGNVNIPEFRTAAGYVLESAGPDGKFGNRWIDSALLDPQGRDINEAVDNIIIQRP